MIGRCQNNPILNRRIIDSWLLSYRGLKPNTVLSIKAPEVNSGVGKRILIVDDAIFMRMIIKKVIVEAGYEVVGEAGDGAEGIEMYKQLKPDLVTMDNTMPEMSGINALKAIREFDPNARVIICTAIGQKFLIREALEAGAVNFIVKPFEDEEMLDCINRALA
jgi:two-component system, chemotaxis family, chemotaxis protein CheY